VFVRMCVTIATICRCELQDRSACYWDQLLNLSGGSTLQWGAWRGFLCLIPLVAYCFIAGVYSMSPPKGPLSFLRER